MGITEPRQRTLPRIAGRSSEEGKGNAVRIQRKEVHALFTRTQVITLAENQFFCSLPKSWEIWQEEPLQRVKRIPNSQILWESIADVAESVVTAQLFRNYIENH